MSYLVSHNTWSQLYEELLINNIQPSPTCHQTVPVNFFPARAGCELMTCLGLATYPLESHFYGQLMGVLVTFLFQIFSFGPPQVYLAAILENVE